MLEKNVKARKAKHRAWVPRTFRPLPERLEDRSLLTVTVSVIALVPDVPEGDLAAFHIVADDPNANVTVSFQTRPGTAIEGADYEGLSDTQTFTGSTTVTITTNPDFVYEPGETFWFELTAAVGAELDPTGFEAQCTIDDDTAIISDIRALEGVKNPDRIVTNATLKLIQGDTVTFRAEPPAGGWLDDDDVIWTVTGHPDVYYSVVNTVTFDTFYDEISVCAYTPGAATVACLDVELVPHPTGIENTRHVPYVNPVGGPYYQGRDYIHDLVPSDGATGQDLFDAYQAGKLEVKEYGVVATDSIGNLPPGEPPPGTGESTFEIVLNGTTASLGNDMVAVLLTELDVNNFTNGNTVFPTLPRQTTFAQDFLWKASATDSTRDGEWVEFVTDNPIEMKLQTEGHTFVFGVSDNGVPYEEFYNGPPLLTQFIVPPIVRELATQPPSPVHMRGGFTAPIGSPPTSLLIDLWDDDTLADDLVGRATVTLEIPTGVPGSPNIWFDETTVLWAVWEALPIPGYVVHGTMGSSGETVADLFFTVLDDTGTAVIGPSPTKTVTALQ